MLSIFSWTPNKQEPQLLKQIFLDTNLDNIEFAQEENEIPNKVTIYIPGHPKGFTFLS